MDFLVKGKNTYEFKEELKSWGCFWNAEKKMWEVQGTDKDDVVYKAIKRLGFQLIPRELTPEAQQIQDILKDF